MGAFFPTGSCVFVTESFFPVWFPRGLPFLQMSPLGEGPAHSGATLRPPHSGKEGIGLCTRCLHPPRLPRLVSRDVLARNSGGWKAEVNVSGSLLSLEASRCGLRVALFSSCLYMVTPAYVFVLISCVCLWGGPRWCGCVNICMRVSVHVFTCIG